MIPKQNLSELEELMDRDIQDRYLELFKEGWINDAKKLYEFTGIEPNYSNKEIIDAIQKGYLKLFKRGDIVFAKGLYGFTKIKFTGVESKGELTGGWDLGRQKYEK